MLNITTKSAIIERDSVTIDFSVIRYPFDGIYSGTSINVVNENAIDPIKGAWVIKKPPTQPAAFYVPTSGIDKETDMVKLIEHLLPYRVYISYLESNQGSWPFPAETSLKFLQNSGIDLSKELLSYVDEKRIIEWAKADLVEQTAGGFFRHPGIQRAYEDSSSEFQGSCKQFGLCQNAVVNSIRKLNKGEIPEDLDEAQKMAVVLQKVGIIKNVDVPPEGILKQYDVFSRTVLRTRLIELGKAVKRLAGNPLWLLWLTSQPSYDCTLKEKN